MLRKPSAKSAHTAWFHIDQIDDAGKERIREAVERLLALRRRREALFGTSLFGEPAWDILLNAFLATLVQRRVTVSQLINLSGVPLTAGRESIAMLERAGLIVRRQDQLDARRWWVEVTDQAATRLQALVASVQLWPTRFLGQHSDVRFPPKAPRLAATQSSR